MPESGVSMLLQNYEAPFIGKDLAQKLARVLVESKYPEDIFVIEGDPSIEDEGDYWRVSFRNRLRTGVDVTYATAMIRVRIKKANGEIADIS